MTIHVYVQNHVTVGIEYGRCWTHVEHSETMSMININRKTELKSYRAVMVGLVGQMASG